ncbi:MULTISPECIES: AHH domain-containing protein [Myxococcus]|uniref:AHH domain-containing protein n=1 Tax=Myxococcus TaxID=32 RepID=UPI0013D4940B|nr:MULTISPECIES: AHH domain-containing protein [Myxococcus]NVJ21930.1 AHH domain-containing protein [Myxococcus sp. AM011]
MEIGEEVAVSEFVSEELHNEKTCPWHEQGDAHSQKMLLQNPDDDAVGGMAPTDGGVLGRKLKDAKNHPPAANKVSLMFKKGEVATYGSVKRPKLIQTYERQDEEEEEYALQYAPHHLIPGNESLKGTSVVPFMGDENCIADYKKSMSSYIKAGYSIGYDINAAENGEWLPSPYALSNCNEWPADLGLKYLKKRKDELIGEETEAFKPAYVAAAIEASGGRQFHMRHMRYSEKVTEILQAIGERLAVMADDSCPLAKKSKAKDVDEFDPPLGLTARLHSLSQNLRGLLTKSVWRPPLYTDSLTQEYADEMVHQKKFARSKAKGSITQIL